MNFDYTPKVQELRKKLSAFMDEHVYPNEHKWEEHVTSEQRWQPVPIIEELKAEGARGGAVEPVAAEVARRHARPTSSTRRCARSWAACTWAPEVFNCSAPDTGNMETLLKYGTPEHVSSGASRCSRERSARRS